MKDTSKIKKFEGSYSGDTFVIFGSGPSLLDWDDSFCEEAIKVGCNTVFMSKPDLDYYFIQDSGLITKSPNSYHLFKEEYDKFKPSISKFYGTDPLDCKRVNHMLKKQDSIDGGAIEYSVGSDLINYDFLEFYSVIFSCLQFASLCKVKKVIVVGCDITNNIRVGESIEHNGYKITNLVERWKDFKAMFPDLNIEVFKPLGLKGLFKEYLV